VTRTIAVYIKVRILGIHLINKLVGL